MEKVLVIVGQTAVGKTSMSIKLASNLNGEIINGDAMQVYKNLNIVTDKIKKEKMGNIPHHLFDIKEIDEDYSVEEYQNNIRKVTKSIFNIKASIIENGKLNELNCQELLSQVKTIDANINLLEREIKSKPFRNHLKEYKGKRNVIV